MKAAAFAAILLAAASAAGCTDPDTPRNRETGAAMPDTSARDAAPAPDAGQTGLAPTDPNASPATGGPSPATTQSDTAQ